MGPKWQQETQSSWRRLSTLVKTHGVELCSLNEGLERLAATPTAGVGGSGWGNSAWCQSRRWYFAKVIVLKFKEGAKISFAQLEAAAAAAAGGDFWTPGAKVYCWRAINIVVCVSTRRPLPPPPPGHANAKLYAPPKRNFTGFFSKFLIRFFLRIEFLPVYIILSNTLPLLWMPLSGGCPRSAPHHPLCAPLSPTGSDIPRPRILRPHVAVELFYPVYDIKNIPININALECSWAFRLNAEERKSPYRKY